MWLRSNRSDGRVTGTSKMFLQCAALRYGNAMRKVPAVCPTTFEDFFKQAGHDKLIPWPEIRAAAAERALDMQTWRNAIKNLALLGFKKPQQVGRMTRSCARCGGVAPTPLSGTSSSCLATLN
eukprot:360753-Chlamydomonas_euryale.AAC.6